MTNFNSTDLTTGQRREAAKLISRQLTDAQVVGLTNGPQRLTIDLFGGHERVIAELTGDVYADGNVDCSTVMVGFDSKGEHMRALVRLSGLFKEHDGLVDVEVNPGTGTMTIDDGDRVTAHAIHLV